MSIEEMKTNTEITSSVNGFVMTQSLVVTLSLSKWVIMFRQAQHDDAISNIAHRGK